MDLNYLLNILLKRKWLILSVVLISSIATYFFIGRLPDTYKAEAVIKTGIINYEGVTLMKDDPFVQKYQIESAFSGLIEKMKSRNIIKILTDQLLSHDLLADGIMNKPFRNPDRDDLELSQNDIDDIVLKLKTNLNDSLLNSKPEPIKPDQRLADAYGYDYTSLIKKLEINRIGETDYLKIGFESESPELSYFVLNTYLEEFFEQHEEDLSFKEQETLKFNREKLKQYKTELDSIVQMIKEYKSANGLVDVSTQRETVIAQQRDLEQKLRETQEAIPSLERNLAFLEKQIFEYNKVTADEAYKQVTYNGEFVNIEPEITKLQEEIIEARVNGSKNVAALERKLENLKLQRTKAMQRSLAVTPKSEKDKIDDKLKDLVGKHLDTKLELELAKGAMKSYSEGVSRLESKSNKLLLDDNYLIDLEQEKYRLDHEYDNIRKEYEDAKYFAEGTKSPLAPIEAPEMPTEPESKNRAVFSAFAGVAGGTLTCIVLFLLAFMDTSIATPSQFSRITNLPLLGFVNKVKVKNMDLQELFAHTQSKNELEYFKENIRKLRTAIENSGAKSFLFVSPKEQEGRSFLVVLLAYALSLNEKKILIIDTNFKNNTLSAFKTKSFIEITTTGQNMGLGHGTGQNSLSTGGSADKSDPHLKNIDIVGNKGGSQSPSEVLAGKDFKKIMESYKKKYDFIFMEAAAMNKFSDARELLPYTEKMAVVFSAEAPITGADKETLEYLKGMNGKMFGGILNNVDMKNI
ncbi:MAG: Wzz/FepE/Etk N-terminal domain-containing protein [Saprospiraceae bacterium]